MLTILSAELKDKLFKGDNHAMKNSFGVLILTFFLSACCCLSQARETGISVETVETSIRDGNPKATLEKYFNCEKYEGSAYEGIASGSPKWVSIAERMLHYSDACYTEGIQSSLGKAMQRSPRNVLPLVNKTPTLAAGYICLPFISNELPFKTQQAEVIRSKKAIQRVQDDKLRTQKEACLRFIRSVEVSLTRQQSPTP